MEESVKKKKRFPGIWVYILCLLVAVLLWLIVMKVNPPKVTAEFRDVPVVVVDAENLQEAGYDYVCATTVRKIVLEGTREDLYRCTREGKLEVRVSLANVTPGIATASVTASVVGTTEGVEVAEHVSVSFAFNKR